MSAHVSHTAAPMALVVGRRLPDGTWRYLAGSPLPRAEALEALKGFTATSDRVAFARAADDPELEQYERAS